MAVKISQAALFLVILLTLMIATACTPPEQTAAGNFHAYDTKSESYYSLNASLASQGNYCEVYVEDKSASLVPIGTAEAIAQEFDTKIFPLMAGNFGQSGANIRYLGLDSAYSLTDPGTGAATSTSYSGDYLLCYNANGSQTASSESTSTFTNIVSLSSASSSYSSPVSASLSSYPKPYPLGILFGPDGKPRQRAINREKPR